MTRPGAKALNKPLLIVGIDRRLAGLAFIFAVIVGAKTAVPRSPPSFSSSFMCVAGRRLTRKDPNIFLVLNQVRKQKALYDPAKRQTRSTPWSTFPNSSSRTRMPVLCTACSRSAGSSMTRCF